MMSRRSAKAFDAFVSALVMTDQEHVAEVLDRNKTTELIRKRDAARGVHTVEQASSSGYTSPSAMVPSGFPVATVPSSHSNAVPSSSGQEQFTPSAAAQPSTSFSTSSAPANEMQYGSNVPVPGTSGAPLSPPVQVEMDVSLTDHDVSDVVDAVVRFPENISLVNDLKEEQQKQQQQQPISHRCPESVIKNGYALIIQNSKYDTKDIGSPISSIVMDDFLRHTGFKTVLCTDATAMVLKEKVQEVWSSVNHGNYDAFLLFFMGFGDYGGQVFDTDAVPVSIKSDILENFNSDNCQALSGKPKIFCFQMARPVEVPMDHTDGDIEQQLKAIEQWSDMIIFSSVTPVACDSEKFADSFDYSNYMHRAVVRVACKFAHELPLYDMLLKVQTILKCQEVAAKIGLPGIQTELYCTPGMRPVYLQLSA